MKRICVILFTGLMFTLSACGSSNEPCDYCGVTPTKAYKTPARTAYVCAGCSTRCHFCDKKATHRFDNMMESVTFVCDECYEDVKSF